MTVDTAIAIAAAPALLAIAGAVRALSRAGDRRSRFDVGAAVVWAEIDAERERRAAAGGERR